MGFNTPQTKIQFGQLKRGWLLALCVWIGIVFQAPARTIPDPSDPIGFFTTVADKLLRSTFGFGVTSIPVYTNGVFVYSPSVQRLLQLSANLYDATTNRTAALGKDYPSVFRPIFTTTASGDLFITGYAYVDSVTNASDPALALPFDAATVAAAGGSNVLVNIYGVPWIIGAKKGFPSFNQFYMLNAVQITRSLQVTKPAPTLADPTPGLAEFRTNQMYIFSISNSLGCSLWNSYTNDYTSSNQITIVTRDAISMLLTNDDPGFAPSYFNNYCLGSTNIINSWPGTDWQADPPATVLGSYNSFVIPVNAAVVLLPNEIYRYAGYNGAVPLPAGPPGFDPYNLDFQTNVNTPQLPQFGLLTTNHLQVFVLDGNHVIDYVHFAGPEISLDITAELADPDTTGNPAYLWSTNAFQGTPTPWGVVNQINISKGAVDPPFPSGTWHTPPNFPVGLPQTVDAIEGFFSAFFNINRLQYGVFIYGGKRYTNSALTMLAPYTPTRMVSDYVSWQANDPLVHYLVSDLAYTNPSIAGVHVSDNLVNPLPTITINNVSKRFSPWGREYSFGNDSGAASLMTLKDPLVWRPDDWNFPAGQDWSLSAIGRIHRGTPWQTVYLKASDILANTNIVNGINGISGWAQWTGNADCNDAVLTAPINDWHLLGLLVPLLNTNDPTQLLSVNDVNSADWLNVLNGMVVLTNSGPDNVSFPPSFDSYIMSSNSPQASLIANAIAQVRMNLPNQRFQSLGDILQTAALTETSPWLNWNDYIQQQYGISDEAYETIPAQLLPLLRQDSIGAVVQSSGGWNIQFSGSDAYAYELQTSTDLINWNVVNTNYPVQGGFNVFIPAAATSQNRFYRSVLLP